MTSNERDESREEDTFCGSEGGGGGQTRAKATNGLACFGRGL